MAAAAAAEGLPLALPVAVCLFQAGGEQGDLLPALLVSHCRLFSAAALAAQTTHVEIGKQTQVERRAAALQRVAVCGLFAARRREK